LQIIGEAASRVSAEAQNRFPQIPWGKMIGMRHVLDHGYFEIDLDYCLASFRKRPCAIKEKLLLTLFNC
jgi:uncharacterized protein with HEPN domain